MDFTFSRYTLFKRWKELFWMNACIFDGSAEFVRVNDTVQARAKANASTRTLMDSDSAQAGTITELNGTSLGSIEAAHSSTMTCSASHLGSACRNAQPKESFRDLSSNVKVSQPIVQSELEEKLITENTDKTEGFAVADPASPKPQNTPRNVEHVEVGGIRPATVSNTSPVNNHPTGDYKEVIMTYDAYDGKLESANLERVSDTQIMMDDKDAESVETVTKINLPTPPHNPKVGPTVSSIIDTDTTVPPASLGQPTVAMLNGFSNVAFHGGSFVQHNAMSSNKHGLEILEKRVATAAFHNSAQRFEPPRCHPDTRVEILQSIHDWIMKSEQRDEWIMWLNGAAGAGKSAIVQSIAERLAQLGTIAIASFFFFRADSTRNTMEPLVATLVYQLIQAIPELSDDILLIIERNPLIFGQSLEFQIHQLIVQPLLRLPKHLQQLFVVFIDGLDECNDRTVQANLIKVLGKISSGKNSRVIFIVSSRREPQIEAEFVRRAICEILQILPLDNSDIEQTSDDIRRFLIDKFRDIKETHLFKRHLPVDWPAASVVEKIIAKSSGQFIFASVVIGYISSPRANPFTRLEIIHGLRVRDPSSQNPFMQLDALYQYIFSQVEVLDKVFDIIGYVMCGGSTHLNRIQKVFLLEVGEIYVLFADLTSVILCDDTDLRSALRFLHASLPDFLLDKSRSEQYHIDLDEYRTKLLCMLLERRPPVLDPLWSIDHLYHVINLERFRLQAVNELYKDAKPKASERLRNAYMNFNSTFYIESFLSPNWYELGIDILRTLKQLDFGDQGEAYHHVVDVFATEYAKCWSLLGDDEKLGIRWASPDLMACIEQIPGLTSDDIGVAFSFSEDILS